MKVLKPNWIHHDGQAIYSIDIHPDGSRIATSGLGDDNGKIIIWSMAPIMNRELELNENIPKILCTMEYHLGCVNAVRWSNNGQYLASGSDDKLCMIWQYSQMSAYQNIENWKCTSTLRGHDGDVLDLAWSAKDQYLASCSVDNTIIIWNAFKFPGLSWDPTGKYLASQSDDKTLKIWRTADWGLEKVIDEPFKLCGNTTHILRLNWSADGQLLISANAIKDDVPIAKVIERDTWKTKLDLVGHRKAVTIVKFYPKILKDTTGNADAKAYCLYALGSRDRSLSIWLTSKTRPITVLYDLFESPIVDITWSKEAISLLCSSMDGTVVYIELSNKEIGYPLTKHEHETFFKLKYAYDLTSAPEVKVYSSNKEDEKRQKNALKFIENVDVLLAQEQQEQSKRQALAVTKPSAVLNESTSSNSQFSKSSEIQKQIERKLPDGRRRITPICIARTIEYETPKPFDSNTVQQQQQQQPTDGSKQLRSQTATEQSTIVVEKRNERDEIIDISPIKSVNYFKQGSINSANSNDNSQFNVPLVVNSNSNHQQDKPLVKQEAKLTLNNSSSTPKTTTTTTTTSGNKPPQPQLVNKSLILSTTPNSKTKQAANHKPTVNNAQQASNKRPVQSTQSNTNVAAAAAATVAKQPQQKPLHNEQNNKTDGVIVLSGNDDSFNKGKLNRSKSQITSTMINLPALKFDNKRTTKLMNAKTFTKPSAELEIENFVNNSFSIHQLKYIVDGNQVKWKSEFSSEICGVAHSSKYIACSCKDYDLSILTVSNGTQLCCPLVLDDHLTFLKCTLNFFMAITCNGYLYVWQFDEDENLLRTFIRRQSCLSVFRDGQFVNAALSDNGQPIIHMSNNKSYFFSMNTQCWHQIPSVSSNLAVSSFIELNDATKAGPLSMAQLREKNDIVKTIDKLNDMNMNQDYTLKNLESQINASIGLNSQKEYKFWLLTYTRYLSDNLYEEKIKELCSFLLGPLYSAKWNSQIMNLKKRDLLSEVLDIIGKNLNLQRLYTSYKQQLSSTKNGNVNENAADTTAAKKVKLTNGENHHTEDLSENNSNNNGMMLTD